MDNPSPTLSVYAILFVMGAAVSLADGRAYAMYPTYFRNSTLIKLSKIKSRLITLRVLGHLDLISTRREVEVAMELTHRDFLHWVLDRVVAAEKLAEFDIMIDKAIGIDWRNERPAVMRLGRRDPL